MLKRWLWYGERRAVDLHLADRPQPRYIHWGIIGSACAVVALMWSSPWLFYIGLALWLFTLLRR